MDDLHELQHCLSSLFPHLIFDYLKLTGEPGEVGMPGRDGSTGQKGSPGLNGAAGLPGTDGEPGRDGSPGEMGPKGPSASVYTRWGRKSCAGNSTIIYEGMIELDLESLLP